MRSSLAAAHRGGSTSVTVEHSKVRVWIASVVYLVDVTVLLITANRAGLRVQNQLRADRGEA